jgi:serine/threonine protein kinase
MNENPTIPPDDSNPNLPKNLAKVRAELDRTAPPKEVGPYHILEAIGDGGMGTVYKAEQRRPIKRLVALKLIKAGFDTREVIARFESERQALARMDHPHIAKVLDAGTTDLGRPYFVMEYVPGVPITKFADDHKLSIRDRLELFIQVCQAIAHAHSKALIHRDIKSTNVLAYLADGKPTVKVIDFGIAKALTGDRLTDQTFNTGQGNIIGTYDSMSPEQADGSPDIDTRTDVYSLGVLLYELLTGAKPFDSESLRKAADHEIRRIIREVEPPNPSTRLTGLKETAADIARLRQANVEALTKQLRSELEWIPLMAMRKDPLRRYASPLTLADDVQNYLEGKPLAAGPESTAYRLKKYIWRYRLATAFAGVVMFSVVGLSILTIYTFRLAAAERRDAQAAIAAKNAAQEAEKSEAEQRKLATENLTRARQAVSDILDIFGDLVPTVSEGSSFGQLAETIASQKKEGNKSAAGTDSNDQPSISLDLINGVVHSYEGFFQRAPNDPILRDDLALMYQRQAAFYQSSVQMSIQPQYQSNRTPEQIQKGDQKAVVSLHQSIDMLRKLSSEFPGESNYHDQLASAIGSLAAVVPDQHESDRLFKEAFDMRTKLASQGSDGSDGFLSRFELAQLLAEWSKREPVPLQAANRLRQSILMLQDLCADPKYASYRAQVRRAVRAYYNDSVDQFPADAQALSAVISMVSAIEIPKDDNGEQYSQNLALMEARYHLAIILRKAAHSAEADSYLTASIQNSDKLLSQISGNFTYGNSANLYDLTLDIYKQAAEWAIKDKKEQIGLAFYSRAIILLKDAIENNDPTVNTASNLDQLYSAMIEVHLDAGEIGAAIVTSQQAAEFWQLQSDRWPSATVSTSYAAAAGYRLGDLLRALLPSHQSAIAIAAADQYTTEMLAESPELAYESAMVLDGYASTFRSSVQPVFRHCCIEQGISILQDISAHGLITDMYRFPPMDDSANGLLRVVHNIDAEFHELPSDPHFSQVVSAWRRAATTQPATRPANAPRNLRVVNAGDSQALMAAAQNRTRIRIVGTADGKLTGWSAHFHNIFNIHFTESPITNNPFRFFFCFIRSPNRIPIEARIGSLADVLPGKVITVEGVPEFCKVAGVPSFEMNLSDPDQFISIKNISPQVATRPANILGTIQVVRASDRQALITAAMDGAKIRVVGTADRKLTAWDSSHKTFRIHFTESPGTADDHYKGFQYIIYVKDQPRIEARIGNLADVIPGKAIILEGTPEFSEFSQDSVEIVLSDPDQFISIKSAATQPATQATTLPK